MKSIAIVLSILALSFAGDCMGQNLMKGEILSTQQGRLHVGTGDTIVTNLGKKDGIVKGDILKVFNGRERFVKNEIGKCAVVQLLETSNLCEIISMKLEIGRSDYVEAPGVVYADRKLYSLALELLNRVVEPYAPSAKVAVYVDYIFDEKNNVTRFSEMLRKEMRDLFAQKNRIKVVGDDAGGAMSFYPEEYNSFVPSAKDYMKRNNVDVVITGSYTVKGDTIDLVAYIIDRNSGDLTIGYSFPATDHGKALAEVVVPYRPMDRKKGVVCNFSYKPKRYALHKEEMKEVVRYESHEDPFLTYNFGRIDFNIVSPVGFKLTINNDVISFDGRQNVKVTLPRGTHRVMSSFKRGYYYNESLMFSSVEEVKKEILLIIEREGDLEIAITADPLYGKEKVDVQMYKRVEREKRVLRPVMRSETEKSIETFKD
jgi:hypothetical protein